VSLFILVIIAFTKPCLADAARIVAWYKVQSLVHDRSLVTLRCFLQSLSLFLDTLKNESQVTFTMAYVFANSGASYFNLFTLKQDTMQ
jgi:hypothetical protein